jgi:integrase
MIGLEKIGHLPLVSLKRGKILLMRDGIAAGKGPGAANVFIASTHAFLGWCVDRGMLEYNPAARIKPLKGGHLLAWTEAEARLAMREFREPERRLVVLAYHTGQRRGDLISLLWSAFDGAKLAVKQQKTGTPLVIPAVPELRKELASWSRDSVFMLTSATGQPWGKEWASMRVQREAARLGMRPGLNIHGLRKLAATRLAEAGCSASEIAAITGHRSLAMVSLYTASARQEVLAEAAVLRLSQGVSQTGTNGRKASKIKLIR